MVQIVVRAVFKGGGGGGGGGGGIKLLSLMPPFLLGNNPCDL